MKTSTMTEKRLCQNEKTDLKRNPAATVRQVGSTTLPNGSAFIPAFLRSRARLKEVFMTFPA